MQHTVSVIDHRHSDVVSKAVLFSTSISVPPYHLRICWFNL